MLRDVRYHSSNQTFRIVKAQIQWRYWIRRPTSEDEIDNSPAGEGVSLSSFKSHMVADLHCRQIHSPCVIV